MYKHAHLVPGVVRRMLGACAVVLALLAIGCTNSSNNTTPTTASLSIASSHTGNFTQGQNGATYTVTVSNAAGAASTSGTVTVTETVPTGMTLVSMAGTGWTCASNTCTRADTLTAGSSYPTITVTVNVALTAAASLTNQVSVSGGGSATANGSDVTTVGSAPALSIAKTHTGNFTQGQNGATYTVTVSNAAGAASTSGTVTVTETVPTGMTLVSMAGTGWTCGGGNTCTRADALAAGSSYPTITVTVNVSLTAGASLTNQVSVSGGGSATANGSNVTTVMTVPTLSITKSHHGSFTQGQNGVTYTVTVSNATGASATSGTVTVTETAPGALTLVSMAGTGWTCPGAGNTCTRSDALAGGTSYPPITVTANVQPAAGAFSNAVSVSGGGSATANATDPTVVFPTNTGCAGTPSGNESLLSGKYAFLLQGFTGVNDLSPMAIAGSFTADGHGNITGGQADLSASSGPQQLTITPTGGYYTVSTLDSATDNRGCLALTFSGGTVSVATYHFALSGVSAGVASKGRIIEFDDDSGMETGTRASGIMRLQTTSAFAQGQLSSRYAFGLDGGDFTGGHYAMGGSFSFSTGTGNVSNAIFDTDDAGTTAETTAGSGSIQSISATTGRGLLTINSNHDAVYIVNPNELFVVQIDSFNGSTPILSGRAIVTPSAYTAASLSAKYIVHLTGNTGGVADVNLGVLTLTPGVGNSGIFAGSLTEYDINSGVFNPYTIPGGSTYTVDPNTGRTTFTGPTKPPVAYITTPTDGISAFVVGTDTDAQFGLTEAQPVTTAPSGTLVVGTEDPGDSTTANIDGVVSIAAGVATISVDSSDGGLFPQNAPFMLTLSTNPDGTGTLSGGDPTIYVVNGTKLFYVTGAGTAEIQDIE